MNNQLLELAKRLKFKAKENIGISDIEVAPDIIIQMCEYIEKTSARYAECEEIIKAACADDVDWHNLINNKEHERALMIALINHISDEYTKIKFELERINNLEPVGYMESNGVDYINKHGFTHINAEKSGSINIPLYKLD